MMRIDYGGTCALITRPFPSSCAANQLGFPASMHDIMATLPPPTATASCQVVGTSCQVQVSSAYRSVCCVGQMMERELQNHMHLGIPHRQRA